MKIAAFVFCFVSILAYAALDCIQQLEEHKSKQAQSMQRVGAFRLTRA